MTAPAAISATFADFKLIKGRKCCQLVFEVPLEQADMALRTLGGLPNPASEAWCGIARLAPQATAPVPEPEKTKRSFGELPIASQAALLCQREAFWRFLEEEKAQPCMTEDGAGNAVRYLCGVQSRAELATNAKAAAKFVELSIEFEAWLGAAL